MALFGPDLGCNIPRVKEGKTNRHFDFCVLSQGRGDFYLSIYLSIDLSILRSSAGSPSEGHNPPRGSSRKFASQIANEPAPYRGLSGPSGPKCRKNLENVSRGLRPRNPEKSPKSLGNSPKRLFRHSPETFRTVPETFWRLFGVPGLEAPGDIF